MAQLRLIKGGEIENQKWTNREAWAYLVNKILGFRYAKKEEIEELINLLDEEIAISPK
jgi:hypothetical protein